MINITVRPAKLEDYVQLSRIRKMEEVIDNILATPDEPEDKMKNRILNKTENDYWYVAELRDQVIGLAILNRHANVRKEHVGQITIMVHGNYHSKGVGSRLMEEITNLSDNILKLKRLELSVFSNNEKAISLYKKYGFKEEGIKKYSALKNGIYADELMMSRILDF